MPRLRFTIRWLMIVVAVVAFTATVVIMPIRRSQYRKLAHKYSQLERVAREYNPDFARATKMDRSGNVIIDVVPKNIDHYAHLRAKYERAARYPWLPLAPDPPEPK